jgi:hypothetical protein
MTAPTPAEALECLAALADLAESGWVAAMGEERPKVTARIASLRQVISSALPPPADGCYHGPDSVIAHAVRLVRAWAEWEGVEQAEHDLGDAVRAYLGDVEAKPSGLDRLNDLIERLGPQPESPPVTLDAALLSAMSGSDDPAVAAAAEPTPAELEALARDLFIASDGGRSDGQWTWAGREMWLAVAQAAWKRGAR